MKVEELTKLKFNNFIDFIKLKYPENEEIDKAKNYNIKFVLEYLKNSIYPNKDDINLLILNISSQYNISIDDFNTEEFHKLKKYLLFFCEMVEEVYYK